MYTAGGRALIWCGSLPAHRCHMSGSRNHGWDMLGLCFVCSWTASLPTIVCHVVPPSLFLLNYYIWKVCFAEYHEGTEGEAFTYSFPPLPAVAVLKKVYHHCQRRSRREQEVGAKCCGTGTLWGQEPRCCDSCPAALITSTLFLDCSFAQHLRCSNTQPHIL